MSSENDCIASRTRPGNHDTNEQDDHLSAAPITIWKKMKIADNAGLEEVATYVKKHQLNVIIKDAKLDILVLQAKLHHDHYLMQRRLSTGQNKSKSKGKSTIRVAPYLMWKKETITEVWSDCWQFNSLHLLC